MQVVIKDLLRFNIDKEKKMNINKFTIDNDVLFLDDILLFIKFSFCKLNVIDESNIFVNYTFVSSQSAHSVYADNCVEECSSYSHIMRFIAERIKKV